MKKIGILLLVTFLTISCTEKDYLVTISTEFGDMKLILFDETPKHKASFIEFAKAGKYDSTTFHRVIKDFMIQGGDVNNKPGIAERDNTLIDAEFDTTLIHTKGMLAGARTNNPQKKSGVQFYIIHGKKFSRQELEKMGEDNFYSQCVSQLNQVFKKGEHTDLLNQLIELQKNNETEGTKNLILSPEVQQIIESEFGPQSRYTYTDAQYNAYETVGGSPHLDGGYTVFGQVVEGIEVLDKIASQQIGSGDKPVDDIFMTVTVEEISRKKITKLYGITYPE